MTTKYMNKESDMVLYKGDDGEIKSLGYTINSVLPYLNIPAMKGGGNIPGKKAKSKQLVIPAGLALLNQAITTREKQNDFFAFSSHSLFDLRVHQKLKAITHVGHGTLCRLI